MGKDRIILERRYVPKGSIIIEQGDRGYCAYLIQSGLVSVYIKHDEVTTELAKLGLGQICGEMALLSEETELRSASVKAIEDCNLIVITHSTLIEKLKNTDPTIKAVVEMLVDRILSANHELFGKTSDFKALEDSVRNIYKNIHDSLNAKDQKRFSEKVFPKMEGFLNSLHSFEISSKK